MREVFGEKILIKKRNWRTKIVEEERLLMKMLGTSARWRKHTDNVYLEAMDDGESSHMWFDM